MERVVCLLLLLSLVGATTSDPISATTSDPISATQALIGRVIGPQYVEKFNLTLIPAQHNGNDLFRLVKTEELPIQLEGSSAVALSSAFNWYLKYTCFSSITWGWDGSGTNLDSLPPPSMLPLIKDGDDVEMASNVMYRYYMNVCTVSYTMAWWDWERWQWEIDWMAMSGINLPLSFIGQGEIVRSGSGARCSQKWDLPRRSWTPTFQVLRSWHGKEWEIFGDGEAPSLRLGKKDRKSSKCKFWRGRGSWG
jgi:alpha-N-acetylglucosaminidase